MLNIPKITAAINRATILHQFCFSSLAVKEVRGDFMYVFEDKQKELQYMRQIQTDDGRKGIVLKIQDPFYTYIGMYDPIPFDQQQTVQIKHKNIAWQSTFESLKSTILKGNQSLFDVNGKCLYQRKERLQSNKTQSTKRKLVSLIPFLDICYDLKYGEMLNFIGCLGSRKTSTLNNIQKQFIKHQNQYSLYLNPSSFSQTQRAVQQGSFGFSNASLKKQTDAGVYMLALKTIHFAKQLSQSGHDVLLGLDSYKTVLHAQWHMLQLMSNINDRKSSEMINYNAPKLSPISLLNEIYSACTDSTLSKGKKMNGSLTAVIITENNSKDQLTPEITPYSNNLKHLSSLAPAINFPLAVRHNSQAKPHIFQDGPEDQPIEYYERLMKFQINSYLSEKKDTELKRQLYKSDLIDAPWDYFQMLDANWWLQGLKAIKPQSEEQLASFTKWTALNIELQLVSHWKLKSIQAYTHFKNYLGNIGQTQLTKPVLIEFVGWAKQQGFFSPFKKDYLN